MQTITAFLRKWIIPIYWILLLIDCVFLYYNSIAEAITASLQIPLLLLYLLLHDNNIGKPIGKLIFFIGLFLALLGDVLQVVINNEVFFISSVFVFILMNICYSISFFLLNKRVFRKPIPFLCSVFVLTLLAFIVHHFLGNEMGESKPYVILYMFSLGTMVSLSANLITNPDLKKLAYNYFIPGSIIFTVQNIILAVTLFHLGSTDPQYIASAIPYAIAQYLMVKGISKAYPQYRL